MNAEVHPTARSVAVFDLLGISGIAISVGGARG
jgi:hypothetical protein